MALRACLGRQLLLHAKKALREGMTTQPGAGTRHGLALQMLEGGLGEAVPCQELVGEELPVASQVGVRPPAPCQCSCTFLRCPHPLKSNQSQGVVTYDIC